MFIARQPIFDINLNVYGYALLFHRAHTLEPFEAEVEALVGDKIALIHCDKSFLDSNLPERIGSERFIVALLENVPITDGLIDRIRTLKHMGYKIAMDDFVEAFSAYPLMPLADLVKYDIVATPLNAISAEIKRDNRENKLLLAEKIETEAEFQLAKEMGFHLFQGRFFVKPNTVVRTYPKSSIKTHYISILEAVRQEEPSYHVLTTLVQKDEGLAYRLMKLICQRSGDELVYTLKRAFTHMGFKELERLIGILMLSDLGENKPIELVRLALIRTKFSEKIARGTNRVNLWHDAAMMGLYSTLDAIMDQDMKRSLEDLELPQSAYLALVHTTGELAPIRQVIEAYEEGNWSLGQHYSKSMDLDEGTLYMYYKESVLWSNAIIDALK